MKFLDLCLQSGNLVVVIVNILTENFNLKFLIFGHKVVRLFLFLLELVFELIVLLFELSEDELVDCVLLFLG